MGKGDGKFASLTETPGTPVTREGADMMFTRYDYARSLADEKRVLEIACGSGVGLGLVGARAELMVGGDVEMGLLRQGRNHYGARAPLVRFDAQGLPFGDCTFDLVLFFEATYYVPDLRRALDEIVRVLGPSGSVVFVNANPERRGFIPSPNSVGYYTADEFREALSQRGFDVVVEGAFPVDRATVRERAVSLLRRAAVKLRLVPRTLRGRARLKRLFAGPLISVPPEINETFGTAARRVVVAPGQARTFGVLYVTARAGPRTAS
jgi:SAM-dependent methyltransferase